MPESSCRKVWARPVTARFDPGYTLNPGMKGILSAAKLFTWITTASSAVVSRIVRTASRVQRQSPKTFTLNTDCHSSKVPSVKNTLIFSRALKKITIAITYHVEKKFF